METQQLVQQQYQASSSLHGNTAVVSATVLGKLFTPWKHSSWFSNSIRQALHSMET
jgi:hypothetical protein